MIYQQAEEAYDYLLEKAAEYHIDVKWKHFSPYTPPGSSYEYRRVVMNLNWHRPKEIIFQFAHELAHVIHGDHGTLYIITRLLPVKSQLNIRQMLVLLNY